jgi:hypothetical protein
MLYKRIKLPYVRVSLRRAKEEGPHFLGRIRADIRQQSFGEAIRQLFAWDDRIRAYKKDRILVAKELFISDRIRFDNFIMEYC